MVGEDAPYVNNQMRLEFRIQGEDDKKLIDLIFQRKKNLATCLSKRRMSSKRRRVRSLESDEDDDATSSNFVIESTKHFNTILVGQLMTTVSPRFDTVDKGVDEIKHKITAHHDETQYVHRKHHDQARMIAVLNEKVNALQAGRDDDKSTILSLHEDIRNLQDSALGDCAGLFEHIKDRMSSVKTSSNDTREEVKKINGNLETMNRMVLDAVQKSNSELESLKGRVTTMENDLSFIKELLIEIKTGIKKQRN